MVKSSILINLLLIVLLNCTKNAIEPDVPECIKDKIVEFNKNPICDDISVDQYIFQNETVFVFNPGTCGADLQSGVVDSTCKTLGALGGLAGITEINGEDFSNAIFVKTVWEK